MRKKDVWAALFCAAALGIGLYCLWGWNRSIEVGFTVLTTQPDPQDLYDEDTQEQTDEEIEALKGKNAYTVEAPLLIADPYGTNTTGVYLYFESEQPASVSYEISTADDRYGSFSRTLSETPCLDHEYQLLGMVPEQENEVTVQISYEDGTADTLHFTYEAPALRGNGETILEQEEGESEAALTDGLYAILGNDNDSGQQQYLYYYDNDGVVRAEIPLGEYRCDRIVLEDDLMYISVEEDKIAALDALGQVVRLYDTGEYSMHHDFISDGEGNLLILASRGGAQTVEDQIIALDLDSGEIIAQLDMGEMLSAYRAQTSADDTDWDWLHLNAIQEKDGDILVSSRETSTIICIDDFMDDPHIDYMIADERIWADSGYEDLLLTQSEEFKPQYGQHSLTCLVDDEPDDGQYEMILFDNNLGISTSNTDIPWSTFEGLSTSGSDENGTSHYYKYLVDEEAGTYTLLESIDLPYSAYVSSVQLLDDHVITDSGMQGVFQEYDADGKLIRSFTVDAENYVYRVYKYTFEGFYFSR